jgi:hypothetical protein
MADYNLTGLNPRDFEHLVQALAKKHIATGITPFGDGRDGGREATFKGKMDYPSKNAPWDGYLVVQCKFCKQSKKEGDWAINQLKNELKKFLDPKRKLPKPEYYLFVTNLKLTAVQNTGTKDRIKAELKAYAPKLGIKGYDVWSYDELCRFIDDNKAIRQTYAGFITSGDVLSEMMKLLKEQKPDFGEVMGAFLQKEIVYEKAAKLESAGQDFDRQILLARVFVDLPASEAANTPQNLPPTGGLVAHLLEEGSYILSNKMPNGEAKERHACFVIVGGPGQGKSTLAQFLCQLYRAAILKDCPVLDPEASDVIKQLQAQKLPTVRRFPVRIMLSQYATDLAHNKKLTLLEYIRQDISQLGNAECSLADLKQWLAAYPWLVVLDGLDEVPASSNRAQVLKQIEDFRIDAANLSGDVQIVATTRPQSYSEELSATLYKHWYITPLSPQQAMNYAQRLVEVRCGADERRKKQILRRLEVASKTEATARLMQSPLQVTIMATLVERIGEPPKQRYRLFEQYYRTIYDREIGREGPLSAILNNRKTDIDIIHYRTGLLLQSKSETVGGTEARLSDERFRALVQSRLSEVGVIGDDANELLRQITDSTLQRLVFLIRPEAEQVAFEIRSLQEFMAAEALLRDGDDAMIARLKAIAPISHWRNVFLFAVGKCFAEHEHLLERLHFICEELNDKMTDPIAEATLWGARLALDIIAEGVANPHPKYERLLAKNALQLITVPDATMHTRLAWVYHNGLADLFQNAIRDRLGQIHLSQQHGAWILLKALADREVFWAKNILAEKWPTEDYERQKQILLLNSDFIPSYPWAIEIIPYCAPFELRKLIWHHSDTLPTWFKAAIHSSNVKRLEVVILSAEDDINMLSANLIPVHANNQLIPLKDMPLKNNDWAPYISAGRFAENPTSATLAQELRWLSDNWDLEQPRLRRYDFLWPLAACLSAIDAKEDLLKLAERADDGQLGSTAQWIAAEERWKQKGLVGADFQSMTDERWPFDDGIDKSGFPFECCDLDFLYGFEHKLWQQIIEKYAECGNNQMKSWLASCALNIIEFPFPYTISITPSELKEIIVSARHKGFKKFAFDLLHNVTFPNRLDGDWAEFFNWLGQQKHKYYISDKSWSHSEQLASWFAVQPDKMPGLLNILGGLALSGCECPVPKDLLQLEQYEDKNSQFSAAMIRLSQNKWDDNDCAKLAQNVVTYLPNAVELSLTMLKRKEIAPERIGEFALALWKVLAESSENRTEAKGQVLNVMTTVMNGRKSTLSDLDIWQRLRLPVLN